MDSNAIVDCPVTAGSLDISALTDVELSTSYQEQLISAT